MRSFEFARKIEDGKVVSDKAFPDAQLPEYQTRLSAGADFFCAEEVVIPSIWGILLRYIVKGCADLLEIKRNISLRYCSEKNKTSLEEADKVFSPTSVHTGIKASMYDDEVLEQYNRSSNPKRLGLILAYSVGVIDADYYNNEDNDGEIMFAFYNFKPWDVTIKVGDRIGQGVFKKFLRPEVGLRVKNVKRKGGVGSTNE